MAYSHSKSSRRNKSWSLALTSALAAGIWVGAGQAATDAAMDPGMQAGAGAAKVKPAAGSKTRQRAGKRAESQPVPMPSDRPTGGRRDPFKLPPPPTPGRGPGEGIATGPVPPGKRGLVIGQLQLEGIVRLDSTNEMIAVVDTARNRAYFLKENDELFNGVVGRITPDSVYFRENVLDESGRVQTREVVKRLSQSAGEGR